MAEHHTTLLQNAYQAFARGDIPAVLEHLADDIEWSTNLDRSVPGASDIPWTRTYKGKADVAKFFADLAGDMTFERFEPNLFCHAADTVIVRIAGANTVKKTGKKVAGDIYHEFTFNARNKVSRFRGFSDTALLLAAHREPI